LSLITSLARHHAADPGISLMVEFIDVVVLVKQRKPYVYRAITKSVNTAI
jgi:hypothetical protein